MKRGIAFWGFLFILGLGVGALVEIGLGAQNTQPASSNMSAERTTPAPMLWTRTQQATYGDLADEVTSVTIYTTSTLVAVWCTGQNTLVNWWSTAKTDLGTTNGWVVLKDTAPANLGGFVLGQSTGNDCILWLKALAAGTSATASILEFKDGY